MKVTAFFISLPLLFICLGFGLENWWLAGAGTIIYFAAIPVFCD
jgi:hypothetical protein